MAVRGHCPVCEEAGRPSLVEVTPTGEPIASSSSRWWRLVLHSDGKGGLCEGSGRKV